MGTIMMGYYDMYGVFSLEKVYGVSDDDISLYWMSSTGIGSFTYEKDQILTLQERFVFLDNLKRWSL